MSFEVEAMKNIGAHVHIVRLIEYGQMAEFVFKDGQKP